MIKNYFWDVVSRFSSPCSQCHEPLWDRQSRAEVSFHKAVNGDIHSFHITCLFPQLEGQVQNGGLFQCPKCISQDQPIEGQPAVSLFEQHSLFQRIRYLSGQYLFQGVKWPFSKGYQGVRAACHFGAVGCVMAKPYVVASVVKAWNGFCRSSAFIYSAAKFLTIGGTKAAYHASSYVAGSIYHQAANVSHWISDTWRLRNNRKMSVNDRDQALGMAVQQGNIDRVQELLASGPISQDGKVQCLLKCINLHNDQNKENIMQRLKESDADMGRCLKAAIKTSQQYAIDWLLGNYNKQLSLEDREECVVLAKVKRNYPVELKLLSLNSGISSEVMKDCLIDASRNGQVDIVRFILEQRKMTSKDLKEAAQVALASNQKDIAHLLQPSFLSKIFG